MGIFERFRSAKTSDDFAVLESDQAKLLSEAEAALVALRADRSAAIEDGDTARVETLRNKIAAAKALCEEVADAVEVARTKRAKMAEGERVAVLEARFGRQREFQDSEILPMMQEGIVLFAEAAAFAVEMRRRIDLFDQENRRLIADGGPQYAVGLPRGEWASIITAAYAGKLPTIGGAGSLMVLPWDENLCIPGMIDPYGGAIILNTKRPHWLAMVFPRLGGKIAAAIARRQQTAPSRTSSSDPSS